MPDKRAIALLGALACALVAAVTWALAFHTELGQAADARVLGRLEDYQQSRLGPLALAVGALGNPLPYAALCATACALALAFRGPRTAVVVAAVIVVPNVVTQFLKQELAEDRITPAGGPFVDPASWPSGHSTAAAALALAFLLAAPVGWRPVVGLIGLAFAGAMAISVVLLGWHLPSDAVGGFAVAGAAGCLAAALLSRPEPTTAPQSRWRRATG